MHAENTLRLSEAMSVISKMKDSYSDWTRSQFFISAWPVFETVLSTQRRDPTEKAETETRGLSETGDVDNEEDREDERPESLRSPRNYVELRTLLNLAASLKSLQCGDLSEEKDRTCLACISEDKIERERERKREEKDGRDEKNRRQG